MGKPRRKGMLKGRLKRFSDQAINHGQYSPHKPSNAERERKPRFIDPFALEPIKDSFVENVLWDKPTPSIYAKRVKSIERGSELPHIIGSTEPMKERTEKWHAQVKNDKVLYGAVEHYEIFEGKSFRHVREAGIKVALKFSGGSLIPEPWKLCFERQSWFWLEVQGEQVMRKSIIYKSAKRAEHHFMWGSITWVTDDS